MGGESKVEVKVTQIGFTVNPGCEFITLESPSRKRISFLMFMQLDGFNIHVSSLVRFILYKSQSHFM